jgi:hypothetical protein
LYKDSTLKINDKIIGENVYLYKKCALYKEAKLVLFIRHNDTERDEIVIYNTLDYTYEKLNKIDNMYINVTDNIYFEDIGFTINVTAVEDDVFIANSNYICNINDDQIINEYIEYIFDPNALEFNNYEVISSVSLVSYKSINGYC